jgi:VanZ family protein
MSAVTQTPEESWWVVRVVFWWVAVALWTAALLTTYPVQVSQEVLPPSVGFPAAKTLHVVAYAGLAGLIPWLGITLGWRWGLLALLSLHAAGTEFFQQFVPLRTGSVTDVVIDHAGLLLGLAVTCKAWWRSPGSQASPGSVLLHLGTRGCSGALERLEGGEAD